MEWHKAKVRLLFLFVEKAKTLSVKAAMSITTTNIVGTLLVT
jgi:hypothetical protein